GPRTRSAAAMNVRRLSAFFVLSVRAWTMQCFTSAAANRIDPSSGALCARIWKYGGAPAALLRRLERSPERLAYVPRPRLQVRSRLFDPSARRRDERELSA